MGSDPYKIVTNVSISGYTLALYADIYMIY